jgi:hypothetical protein
VKAEKIYSMGNISNEAIGLINLGRSTHHCEEIGDRLRKGLSSALPPNSWDVAVGLTPPVAQRVDPGKPYPEAYLTVLTWAAGTDDQLADARTVLEATASEFNREFEVLAPGDPQFDMRKRISFEQHMQWRR